MTELSLKQLNRALLARQLLLKRENKTAAKAIEALGGLQAQLARPPFIGLWSRLQKFGRADLIKPLQRREVVRVTAMRGTLHLMNAKNYVALRAAIQPALDRGLKSVLGARLDGFDLTRVVADARKFLEKAPATFEAVRVHLIALHPKNDERAMGYAVRLSLPLVQVPTDADWGFPGSADFAVAQQWLGKPIGSAADPSALVLRYLGSFGPATVADAQNWSGLLKLGDTFEALRPKLKTFRDEKGRELFDLPKAPRPSADVPAPVRFMPDYDNLILGHADRNRIIADAHRPIVTTNNLQLLATFLVDGRVAGTWRVERSRKSATLLLKPFEKLSKAQRAEATEEGQALLRFVEPDAETFSVR